MKLKLDMSCHLLNAYTKFQIDISKHAEKSPENSDGRTDGQTDGHCHSIIRPFFKRAYKKQILTFYFLCWVDIDPKSITGCQILSFNTQGGGIVIAFGVKSQFFIMLDSTPKLYYLFHFFFLIMTHTWLLPKRCLRLSIGALFWEKKICIKYFFRCFHFLRNIFFS